MIWTFEDHPRPRNTARNRNPMNSECDEVTKNAKANNNAPN